MCRQLAACACYTYFTMRVLFALLLPNRSSAQPSMLARTRQYCSANVSPTPCYTIYTTICSLRCVPYFSPRLLSCMFVFRHDSCT